ncbi:MAG: hypothetical protein L3J07_03660 [Candidatus Magasanikbacteria bacterium]|nr:hypothetical protein [Candidatus Magasanikbacteria bacterium]
MRRELKIPSFSKEEFLNIPNKEYFSKFENALEKDAEFNFDNLSEEETQSLISTRQKFEDARKSYEGVDEKFSEVIENSTKQDVINVLLGGDLSTFETSTILRLKKDDPDILAAASVHKPTEVISVLAHTNSEFSSQIIQSILESKPSLLITIDLKIQLDIISKKPEYLIFADSRVQEDYLNKNPDFLSTLKDEEQKVVIASLLSLSGDYNVLDPILEKIKDKNSILKHLDEYKIKYPKEYQRYIEKPLKQREVLLDTSTLIKYKNNGDMSDISLILALKHNVDIKEKVLEGIKDVDPDYYEKIINKIKILDNFINLPIEQKTDLLKKGMVTEEEVSLILKKLYPSHPEVVETLLRPTLTKLNRENLHSTPYKAGNIKNII